jgi:transcription termination factor Rho
MQLQELKRKPPAELLAQAEELEIENASALRKQGCGHIWRWCR